MSDQPRQIIQLAAASGGPGHAGALFALASDGTVWRLAIKLNYTWFQLPDLPAVGAPPAGTTSVAI